MNPRIFQAHLQVIFANATCKNFDIGARRKLFKINIPQPRDVVPIGLFVVDKNGKGKGALIGKRNAQVLVHSRGVFRQVQKGGVLDNLQALKAAVLR